MAIRYGANGMPMPEKKKPAETIQEILEVNPNAEEENLSSDWEVEEEETDEEL